MTVQSKTLTCTLIDYINILQPSKPMQDHIEFNCFVDGYVSRILPIIFRTWTSLCLILALKCYKSAKRFRQISSTILDHTLQSTVMRNNTEAGTILKIPIFFSELCGCGWPYTERCFGICIDSAGQTSYNQTSHWGKIFIKKILLVDTALHKIKCARPHSVST